MIGQVAMYLCRLASHVKVYEFKDDAWVEVRFRELYYEMKRDNINSLEKRVQIGKAERLETRLIIHKMPRAEAEKRIRNAKRNRKKKGRNPPSKEYIARSHLNLFITNAKTDIMPTEHVWSLYRLRWQIELIFKIWKSICGIDKIKKTNKHRLECYIYSKLILILLCWQLVWNTAKNLFVLEDKVLSFYKSFKTLIYVKVKDLREAFLLDKRRLDAFLSDFYLLSRRKHILEGKRGEPTSMELLLSYSTS
jgi:hypothetical protein